MARTDGHVTGLRASVNSWLLDGFLAGNFAPDTPGPGTTALCMVSTDIPGSPPGQDPETAIRYSLLDRAGNLALWVVDHVDVLTFLPDPTGSPLPLVCGAYTISTDNLDPGVTSAENGWGADPACLLNFWTLPRFQDLLFVTLSNVSYKDRMRSMGSEYVIAIQDNTSGSTLLRDRWWAVLENARTDEIDFADSAVVQLTALGHLGAENYQVVGERAI